jgi:bifunctional non-homologous end joining protein LigD
MGTPLRSHAGNMAYWRLISQYVQLRTRLMSGKHLMGVFKDCLGQMSEKGLKEALDRMKPFFTDKSPFVNPTKIPEKIQWVKPALVCEVAFAEWTLDGELRQTTFLG